MTDPHNTPPEGEYQARQEWSQPTPTKTHWVTKAGDCVDITEMGDGHLINTICMLRRQGLKAKAVASAQLVRGYDTINGEAAQDALAMEIQYLEEQSMETFLGEKVPCYGPMLKEAAKRNLTIPPVTEREMDRATLAGAQILLHLGDWEKGGK